MNKVKVVCAIAAGALFLAGCGGKSDVKKQFSSLADFNGARVGVIRGSISNEVLDENSIKCVSVSFDMLADIVTALKTGKIDATVFDLSVSDYIIRENPDIAVFPTPLRTDRYGFAVAKGSQLGEKANAVLEKLMRDGTIKKLEEYWFSADGSENVMPKLDYKPDFDGSAGTIKWNTDATFPPLCYIAGDGSVIGFEPDIVSRIAYELNMNIEITSMYFHGLLPALASGKADMVGSTMSITEERLKTVDFVGPYFEGDVVFMVKRDRLGN